ncbi:MAG: YcnI family protein [Actinomycetota bacterium]
MFKKIYIAAVAAATVALSATSAFAHVTVKPSEAIAGGFETFVIQVPNERDDAATTRIEVQFPPAFASVSFQPKPGWNVDVETVRFDEPIEAFGEEVTEGVGSVTISGGRIEPGEFETFPFSVGPLPEGDLEFKAIQTYDSGEVVRWVGPPDSETPAPHVVGISLDLEEGEGQLAALAELQQQAGGGGDDAGEADDEDDGGSPLLDYVALGVAILALIVALLSRSRSKAS